MSADKTSNKPECDATPNSSGDAYCSPSNIMSDEEVLQGTSTASMDIDCQLNKSINKLKLSQDRLSSAGRKRFK